MKYECASQCEMREIYVQFTWDDEYFALLPARPYTILDAFHNKNVFLTVIHFIGTGWFVFRARFVLLLLFTLLLTTQTCKLSVIYLHLEKTNVPCADEHVVDSCLPNENRNSME